MLRLCGNTVGVGQYGGVGDTVGAIWWGHHMGGVRPEIQSYRVGGGVAVAALTVGTCHGCPAKLGKKIVC
jgi:hypothetical protein